MIVVTVRIWSTPSPVTWTPPIDSTPVPTSTDRQILDLVRRLRGDLGPREQLDQARAVGRQVRAYRRDDPRE